ncbi:MAG: Smr/MutS family protein [Kiloniellales bacterium]|nr:Smr/MutS family protein [Kiloniellales bacterium]
MARPPRDRKGDRRSPSGLSAEDLDLWRRVTSDMKPLQDRAKRPPRDAETPAGRESAPPARRSGLPRAKPVPLTAKAAPAAAQPPSGLDRRQAERLKRGQTPIDARLDLHGHTQAEAHRVLIGFLTRAQADGKRCVLVVTGRGLGKGAGGLGPGGVLKREVPRWLGLPPLRERVLSFETAQPKHGGDGALYVLLRRQR